jgi:cell division protein FtsB
MADDKKGLDYRWIIAFVLQFLVLFGTLMWKGGALENKVESLQSDVNRLGVEQQYQRGLLDNYFKK